jgi:hypothetical protein
MKIGRRVLPLLLLAAACSRETEPALRVGAVTFPDQAVGGLSADQIERLGDLAALGQMVARDEVADVGEPLARRALERSRLPGLPVQLAAELGGIHEAQLREAYERNPEWELEVRHLVRLVPRWAAAEERASAKRLAEEAHTYAVAGEDFEALVARYSEEPRAAERGGRLEPAREGAWVEPFWTAANALEPGTISPVVETEYGYHVIRLENRERVPYEEVNRTRLLSALIPPADAVRALESWVATRIDALAVDHEEAEAWFPRIRAGEAPREIVFARWSAGLEQGSDGEYTAWDAALSRASLGGEERDRLDAGGPARFAQWVEEDARQTMLAVDGLRFGVPRVERAGPRAMVEWEARAGSWGRALGFQPGMSNDQIGAAALRALAQRGQEATIARQDLVGARPLLRRRYAVSGRLAPPSNAESRSPSP